MGREKEMRGGIKKDREKEIAEKESECVCVCEREEV